MLANKKRPSIKGVIKFQKYFNSSYSLYYKKGSKEYMGEAWPLGPLDLGKAVGPVAMEGGALAM